MDTGPMLPLPTPGLLATPPPTPTTMVPTTISARGLLMLSPRLMLMLMPTTAPSATMVWDTPTTDSMDTGPMPPPLPTAMALGLTATPPPTPMADTIIEQLILSAKTQQSKSSRYQP